MQREVGVDEHEQEVGRVDEGGARMAERSKVLHRVGGGAVEERSPWREKEEPRIEERTKSVI